MKLYVEFLHGRHRSLSWPVAMLAALLSSPALSEDAVKSQEFYKSKASLSWFVYGQKYPKGTDRNDVCFARKDWEDGSAMELVKDLADGDIHIWIRNYGWSYKYDEKDPLQEVRANLFRPDGSLVGGSRWNVRLLSKNTMIIPGFPDQFTKFLGQGDLLVIIPPGNIENINVGFEGAIKTILTKMRECVQRYPLANETDPFSGKGMDDAPSLELPKSGPVPFPPKSIEKATISNSSTKRSDRNQFLRSDQKALAAIAAAQKLDLPIFKMPDEQEASVNDYSNLIGIWSSDIGWGDGKGRYAMIIITDAKTDGKIKGFYVWGPPTKSSWSKMSAGYRSFEENVEGNRFSITLASVIAVSLEKANRLLLESTKKNQPSEKTSLRLHPMWQLVRN